MTFLTEWKLITMKELNFPCPCVRLKLKACSPHKNVIRYAGLGPSFLVFQAVSRPHIFLFVTKKKRKNKNNWKKNGNKLTTNKQFVFVDV
jgi:hypothetical protein